MFGTENQNNKRKNASDAHVVTTIIGEDTEFRGALSSQGSVRVEGNLEGQINAQGEIYIGPNSKVKADIFGKKVIVAGEIIGNIEAISGLEIAASGRVFGDITGDRLIVEEGAIYKGRVNMDVISAQTPEEAYEFRPKAKRDVIAPKVSALTDELTEKATALARN
jgi:cytoskeletal protein CcmA (bactofilin family)